MFRKGTALLGPEEMEGEYAGEDLRKEVCSGYCWRLYFSHWITFLASGSDGGKTASTTDQSR